MPGDMTMLRKYVYLWYHRFSGKNPDLAPPHSGTPSSPTSPSSWSAYLVQMYPLLLLPSLKTHPFFLPLLNLRTCLIIWMNLDMKSITHLWQWTTSQGSHTTTVHCPLLTSTAVPWYVFITSLHLNQISLWSGDDNAFIQCCASSTGWFVTLCCDEWVS